jgi:hypothetical protein
MATKKLIQRIELSSTQSSITFSDIPQTYTDLLIVLSVRTNNSLAHVDGKITFNGSTLNYSRRNLYGTGSGVYSTSASNQMAFFDTSSASTRTANTFANVQIYIPNYTSSNYKSYSSEGGEENNSTTAIMGIWAGLWSDTSAITEVKLEDYNGGSWVQYSSAALYGFIKGTDGVTTVS